MSASQDSNRSGAPAFLTRLARDKRGNTLAMLAIALIPLLGLVGSAVDTARLYVVKVRLQQACDAGVLAGRKFMSSSASTTLDQNAADQAHAFFNNNFKAGIFASTSVSFTPSKTADNQVAGSASVTVPMTLTQMMGFGPTRVSVTCEARFDVADLDIMFVLDTTGSMAYEASNTSSSGQAVQTYTRADGTTGYYTVEKSNARIKALRSSVLNFYDTMVTAADATTKIRYGIVPYSSSVNVGKIIPASFLMSGTYNYQTRIPVADQRSGSSSSNTYTGISQTSCDAYASRTPSSGYNASGQYVTKTVTWTATRNGNGNCVVTSQTWQQYYRFGQMPVDISQYVRGDWVQDPSKTSGSSKWQGCIEERDTSASASFSQSALPNDLDPTRAATNDATRWRPMWPDIIYERNNQNGPIDVTSTVAAGNAYENLGAKGSTNIYTCGKEARRLGEMSRSDLASFLNDPDFRPMGYTYHDVGMIWGTRFLDPNGPFASDTAAWPGRKTPIRHIVFMTDGIMQPQYDLYGTYGFERHDKRVTGGNSSILATRHNARFVAECEAAKNRNITVWVIAFGQALTPEMRQCASSTAHAFFASSDAELNSAFQSIASRVAMLRLSK